MTSNETLQLIARLRRDMPRNADVLAVCTELEKFVTGLVRKLEREFKRFDKVAYQRDYMRVRRAKQRQMA